MDKSLTYINYTTYMQEAIIAALNTQTFPNPKVGAVLVDKFGNIKIHIKTVIQGKNISKKADRKKTKQIIKRYEGYQAL